MTKKVVFTENAPSAIGPYSQAIASNGILYCSGQIPIDPASGELVTSDIKSQTLQVMRNLQAVLEAGGSSFEKVIKMQIFLKNMDDFAAVNEVYGEFLSEPYPARCCVAVAQLPKNVDVEIDALANI